MPTSPRGDHEAHELSPAVEFSRFPFVPARKPLHPEHAQMAKRVAKTLISAECQGALLEQRFTSPPAPPHKQERNPVRVLGVRWQRWQWF